MKFGITVNVGNYNSLRCDSSDHETLRECYEEMLTIVSDWNAVFPAVKWWLDKLNGKINEVEN